MGVVYYIISPSTSFVIDDNTGISFCFSFFAFLVSGINRRGTQFICQPEFYKWNVDIEPHIILDIMPCACNAMGVTFGFGAYKSRTMYVMKSVKVLYTMIID